MGAAADPVLVRVAVSADGRRAHLVLPSGVTLVELLPELLLRSGLLDASTAHRRVSVLGPDGRPLDLDATLRDLGVSNGSALRLVVGEQPAGQARPPDDLVEAIADVVGSLGDEGGPDAVIGGRHHRAVVVLALLAAVLIRSSAASELRLALGVAALCWVVAARAVAAGAVPARAGARARRWVRARSGHRTWPGP